MKEPDASPNEQARLDTLHALEILDTPSEERFDRLTRIAKRLFDVPIALVSLVDENRQWFKSCFGLNARQTSREISFCGHAILGDDIFIIPDALLDERFSDNPLVLHEPHIRFYAGCPLSAPNGHKLGTLCIIDRKPRTLCATDLEALKDLTIMVERELVAVQLATLDDLTNISNRRGFTLLAQHSIHLCARQHVPASLVFMDLDKFKSINDRFGHTEGDHALKVFAENLAAVCRDADVFARLSGDEFVMLLFNTSTENAQHMIERLSQALDSYNHSAQRGYQIQFSHGIVDFNPSQPKTLAALLADGDTLMYELKKTKN